LRISVRDITPVRRPEILAPGKAAAETAGKELDSEGDAGVEVAGEERTACEVNGVAGADDFNEGLAASTTHILCDRVATSFATVCARVEYGLTWNTGRHQNLAWRDSVPPLTWKRILSITNPTFCEDHRYKVDAT
jgi:hypothetical protein